LPIPFATLDDVKKCAESGVPLDGVDLSHAEWEDLDFLDLRLQNCTARDTHFRQVELEGLVASDCTFINCDFRSANLNGARFQGCSFSEKETHQGCSFRFSDFQHAVVKQCDFSFSSFDRCDLFGLEIEDCQFRGADLAASTFSRSLSKSKDMVRVTARDSRFEHANLRGLNLSTLQAEKCTFSQAAMEECNLTDAVLLECDLGGAALLSAVMDGANLSGSNLDGLDLRLLKSHNGLIILDHQQRQLMTELGIDVL
jgi:fluoroquinolone resistance protein